MHHLLIALLTAAAVTGTASRDARQVERLERDWSSAYLKQDAARIDAILADDFVGIDGRGVASTKADELKEAITRNENFLILDERLTDVTVRVYGNAAVLNAVNNVAARIGGKDSALRYRRTTVWVKREGRWRCVSFHASRIMTP